jgi:hypothetical protein
LLCDLFTTRRSVERCSNFYDGENIQGPDPGASTFDTRTADDKGRREQVQERLSVGEKQPVCERFGVEKSVVLKDIVGNGHVPNRFFRS